MATVIASNLAVFSDASGHGNQSHLVYAATQQRWWCFVIKTKTATVVSSYVSSSNDLTTATWSASTDSPALTQAVTANDQRNFGCLGVTIGSTDAVHVDVTTSVNGGGQTAINAHIRATFTGASSITWESWNDTTVTNGAVTQKVVKGNVLALSSTGKVHGCQASGSNSGSAGIGGDPNGRLSTNVDTSATWTTGFGTPRDVDDSMASACNSFALAQLASDAMLLVFENSSVSDANCSGLRYNKYASGTTWPVNTGNADVGIGSTTQDENDWCLCRVDNTHLYAFRRSGSNTFVCRKFDGSTTWSTPASAVPNQNHLAASGLFAATDGTDLYLFLLDSASNQPVQYVKGSTASGTISFGSWTQLEAAGSTARNYISGYPVVANSQIGVLFTAVNGSNFDIVVTALSLAGGSSVARTATDAPTTAESMARTFVGARAPTDAPTTAESLTRAGAFARTVTGAPQVAESLGRVGTFGRATTNAPTTAESLVRTFAGSRAPTDTPTTADAATRIGVFGRAPTDAPTTSESATRVSAAVRTATDAPTVSEAVTRLFVGLRGTTEAPQVAESLARLFAGLRTAADAPQTAEAATRVFAGSRIASEAPTTAESLTRVFVGVRTATDAPHTSESAAALSGKFVTTTDAPSVAEALTRTFAGSRTLADAPTTSDSAVRVDAAARVTTDAPHSSESVADISGKALTATDAPTTSESAVRTLAGVRTTADSPTAAESVLTSSVLVRATTGVVVFSLLAVAVVAGLNTFESGNLLVWRAADSGVIFSSTDPGASFHSADPGRTFRESSI